MRLLGPHSPSKCEVEGCSRPIEQGTLCAAHRKRRYRGRPMSTPLRSDRRAPAEELLNAALALADASSEDDAEWARARNALERAALGFARSRDKSESVPAVAETGAR